ncbi:hypothetical protein G6F50_014558 [Rhizopus delemar]|uniref:Uncharacterized protein n=1 Tax=Rhizopus delemar TaxID=936053 RepID=A0A9P7C6W0_9FUNG|nr:hypothetical protein G6F50_014558 [Rhizopus delemar]
MPAGACQQRVALMAGGADGVENLVLHTQHACHQVQLAAGQLRVEQVGKGRGGERAARQYRCIRCRPLAWGTAPATYRIEEIGVAHVGAVEHAHARGNRIWNHSKHRTPSVSLLRSAGRGPALPCGTHAASKRARTSAVTAGIGRKRGCPRTRCSQARTSGNGARPMPPSPATSV